VETAQESSDADEVADVPSTEGAGATEAEAPAHDEAVQPEGGRAATPTA
jgi:hypothetical protein